MRLYRFSVLFFNIQKLAIPNVHLHGVQKANVHTLVSTYGALLRPFSQLNRSRGIVEKRLVLSMLKWRLSVGLANYLEDKLMYNYYFLAGTYHMVIFGCAFVYLF